MPIPIILGAAALVTAAYGAKKGYDGYQKHSEADDTVNSAKRRYEETRTPFDIQEKATNEVLDVLGQEELKIGQQFNEFKTLADDLLQKLNSGRQDKLEISIAKHKLQKIEGYSYTAIGVLGAAAGAGAAGAAAGFAIYGGVMALGAASTGISISALSGVAATNATLAAIGGGSLATGGLGMAGGSAILGAAVAGPVLAIAGWAYNSHGEEAIKNANKINSQVGSAIAKLKKAQEQLSNTEDYALAVSHQIEAAKMLKQDPQVALAQLSDTIMRAIGNGYALAAILVDLITTPLFRVKHVNGEIQKDENGVPVMDTDEDGSMILNTDQLDKQLCDTKTSAARIEPA